MTRPEPAAVLRGTLERYLDESFGGHEVGNGGDFLLRQGSVLAYVQPLEWTDDRTLVRMWATTNVGMRVDGELTRFLATENGKFVFGGLYLEESGPRVVFAHTLLGDFLSRRELVEAVTSVVTTADSYGDQIKERFGGQLSSEPDELPARDRVAGLLGLLAGRSEAEAGSVSALRRKLERYLEELYDGFEVDSDGDFVITSGSVPVWIRPMELFWRRTGVHIWSITNVGVRVDDELTRFIATENRELLFGVLHLSEDRPLVALGHTLLGEFLNRKELETVVAAVAETADAYDDRIKARFGGRLLTET
jgi:hypothetical protein